MHHQLDNRLLSVDLLRALAATSVFLFHANLFAGFDKFRLSIYVPIQSVTIDIPNFFSLGASGVSLFFVVSGYCLTRSWYRKPVQTFNYSDYYFRRFARIYPAYLFSLLVTILIWVLIRWNGNQPSAIHIGGLSLVSDFLIHTFFLHGFLPFSFQSFNGTLWSMSTEIQFYLVLPFLFTLLMRSRPLTGVALTGVFCLLLRYLTSNDPTLTAPIEGGVAYAVLISYGLPGRLCEFVIGIFIASLEIRSRLPEFRLPTVVIVVGTSVLIRWKGPGWLVDPFFGIGFGIALVWLLRNIEEIKAHLIKSCATIRNVQSFGMYSYSFFLIHWPILLVSDRLQWMSGRSAWVRLAVEAPVCFFVCFFVARWMFLNIEERGQAMLLNWRSVFFSSP